MNYPSKKSVELGLKLVCFDMEKLDQNELVDTAIEETTASQNSFGQVRLFNELSVAFHEQMSHHSPIAASCYLQIHLLKAIMAKMFVAGWMAGRQEVIDQSLKQMFREQP
jgi:hypothetical protein